MTTLQKPIGTAVLMHILEMQEEMENHLNEINEDQEWAVRLNYRFELSPMREIRDKFTVTASNYTNEKRQGTYKFEFNSLESIFTKEICEAIYKVTQNPADADSILNHATPTIEFLSR